MDFATTVILTVQEIMAYMSVWMPIIIVYMTMAWGILGLVFGLGLWVWMIYLNRFIIKMLFGGRNA